jgi:glutamyl-tRNA(Gln) amidotransferase subunit E
MKTKKSPAELEPQANYHQSIKQIGYRPRGKTPAAVYSELGFMSGLEVHQQLLTDKKLFCHRPAGIYQRDGAYDAEVVRHMRPTLSELGEYDGTALMEFKTRKNIFYRIANRTTCTYETDDTPPFKINRDALDIAIEIALLLKSNIVGELHITRKQYLDGSIPTGFQRTAIVGIEGDIPLKKKPVRIIQISIEEDSCREISDIGHDRIYTTDRLGMPLIETVTYPDMKTPDEVAEAAQYIRFMNRSTGKVRTGIGAARQDVNVSITGGTRVEIKGVAHIRLIPELTHNEAFRQKSFLHIRSLLQQRPGKAEDWDLSFQMLKDNNRDIPKGYSAVAVNLPGFANILSMFNQPGRVFADEISDRLKVIACIEKPNMTHSEEWRDGFPHFDFDMVRAKLDSSADDAQIVFWAADEDVKTAIDTIRERCRLAFAGVPNETRKARADGTTVFERVLPGPDRMYPDTDSAPIPVTDTQIARLQQNLPIQLDQRLAQLQKWIVPKDCYTYLLRHNLVPLLEQLFADYLMEPRYSATLLAQRLKYLQGRITPASPFRFDKIHALAGYIRANNLQPEIMPEMLPQIYAYPNMDFASVLSVIGYRRHEAGEIMALVPVLREKFRRSARMVTPANEVKWIMRELRAMALGNIPLADLAGLIRGEDGK